MENPFDNAWHSSSPMNSIACAVFLILTYTAVGLRFHCKILQKPKRFLALDDGFIILALLLATGSVGVYFWGLKRGGGSQEVATYLVVTGNYQGLRDYLTSIFVSGLLVYSATTLVRLSVLWWYKSIFTLDDMFQRLATALIIISIAWTISCSICFGFICNPMFHARLDPSNSERCKNYMIFFLTTEIIETMLDTAVMALPIPRLVKLVMPVWNRVSVIGIFALGGFVIITNILRIFHAYRPHFVNIERLGLWTTIHVTSAIVCACLPLYRPLVLRMIRIYSGIFQLSTSLPSRSRRQSDGITSTSLGMQRNGNETTTSTRHFYPLSDLDSRLSHGDFKYEVEVHGNALDGIEHEIGSRSHAVITIHNRYEVV